jgi:hypothetical protein
MTRLDAAPVVTGCARSGTTLLRVMLDSHPEMAVPFETTFLRAFARRAERIGPDAPLFAPAVDRIRSDPGWPRLGVEDAFLDTLVGLGAREMVRRVFERHAADQGAARWGDKNPRYVFHVVRIARLLPETRFIHIVRDGRDVATSLVESRFGAATLPVAAAQWAHRVSVARRQGELLGTARYREVSYERLVARPREVLEEICTFIGLEYSPAMLSYAERTDRFLAGPAAEVTHRHLTRPPTPGIRDWKRDLDPRDRRVVESIAGRELRRFGYQLEDRPSRMLAVRGTVPLLKDMVRLEDRVDRLPGGLR